MGTLEKETGRFVYVRQKTQKPVSKDLGFNPIKIIFNIIQYRTSTCPFSQAAQVQRYTKAIKNRAVKMDRIPKEM